MSVIDSVNSHSEWLGFLMYKQENNSLTSYEEKNIKLFIDNRRYEHFYRLIKNGTFPADYAHKLIINKEGSGKKRVVYSYDEEEYIVLKFIAYKLYCFDEYFADSCYAFRRGYGAKDAIRRFRGNKEYSQKYCFKADVSNYFNSIDVDMLLERLSFIKEQDEELFALFCRILKEERVYEGKTLISEKHGAMAGTPCSPFFANVYLSDVDRYFEKQHISYFRYSDDILIFADTREKLEEQILIFYEQLKEHHLDINPSKVTITEPGEIFEFLGFAYHDGEIDLSGNTMRKMKAKIKRKADALRRWQRKKKLPEEKAAIGFINAMNKKFFGGSDSAWDEDDFTWCRWFFPNITTDISLREIDEYMQEYIRYVITGRHYKGNYRITYRQLKAWGYRSLVHEYYSWKKL